MERLILELAFLVVAPTAISLGQVVEERNDSGSAEVVQIGSCHPTVAPEVARAALGYFERSGFEVGEGG